MAMIAFKPVSGSLQKTTFLWPKASSWLKIESSGFSVGIRKNKKLYLLDSAKVYVFFIGAKGFACQYHLKFQKMLKKAVLAHFAGDLKSLRGKKAKCIAACNTRPCMLQG